MTNLAHDIKFANDIGIGSARAEQRSELLEMGRVPCIAIHAFCDTPEIAATIEIAAIDRHMSRAHVSVRTGGAAAAVKFYQLTPTPNLIVVESRESADQLLESLDALAAVCDVATKLVVIGVSNDIRLYRELVNREVSEYLLAPVDPTSIVAAVSRIYCNADARKLGKVYAFVGAKGGVGSSTVAHNVAWSIGRRFDSDVLLADMDLAFGTASLNFDRKTINGIAEAINNADRLDEVMLDRLLTKCGDRLSLLAAPSMLDKSYDLDEGAFDQLFDLARSNFPQVVLDVPHLWTAWSKKALFIADEVVITAVPDLANLTNAKHLVDILKQLRPLDAPPKLVLNQVGVPKRPEIKLREFTEALQLEPVVTIASDPELFGQAANVGQIVSDMSARSKASRAFMDLAQAITGRKQLRRRGLTGLKWLLGRTKSGQSGYENRRDAA